MLKGVFSASMQAVNFVNAPVIAKNKGIEVVTTKSETTGDYIGSISVSVTTDKDCATVSGALIAKDIKRIVKMNDYNLSIAPEEHVLVVPHDNKPSMIAKVATVIGENGININNMTVAPNEKNDLSMMIISTGSAVDKNSIEKINKIDGVKKAKYVHLNK